MTIVVDERPRPVEAVQDLHFPCPLTILVYSTEVPNMSMARSHFDCGSQRFGRVMTAPPLRESPADDQLRGMEVGASIPRRGCQVEGLAHWDREWLMRGWVQSSEMLVVELLGIVPFA